MNFIKRKLAERKSRKDFEKFDREAERKKYAEYRLVIKKARIKCWRISQNYFVDSCFEFLKKNGFLTDNQIAALNGIEDRRNRLGHYHFDSMHSYMDDGSGADDIDDTDFDCGGLP